MNELQENITTALKGNLNLLTAICVLKLQLSLETSALIQHFKGDDILVYCNKCIMSSSRGSNYKCMHMAACQFDHEKSALVKAQYKDSQGVCAMQGGSRIKWGGQHFLKCTMASYSCNITVSKQLQKVSSIQTASSGWVSDLMFPSIKLKLDPDVFFFLLFFLCLSHINTTAQFYFKIENLKH